MLSQTFGTDKIVASKESKILAPKILHIDTTGIKEYTIPEKLKPKAPLTKLYALEANGTLGKAYSASSTAAPSATEFVYAEDSGKITLPKPLDVYYSPDVIVMVFDKKESYPYYKEYQNHTLE